MNIQQFNYVLAVAEHRHFETAAEKCFVAQSTLSTMITRFEDEIEIKIFDRRVKPVELTEEGEVVVMQLKRIKFEIDQLNEQVQVLKGEMKGDIKIGCIPTIAPFLLPLFLQRFSDKYPNLFFEVKELTTDEIESRILSRELDIGIVSTSMISDELIKYPIYEEDFVLFDASNRTQEEVSINTLDMERFWLLEEGHCMRTQVLEICDVAKPKMNTTFNINYKAGSIDSLLRFVKSNEGKTLLPSLATTDFTEEEKQHLYNFQDDAPSRTIGLVVHQYFVKTKVMEGLLEEITKTIKMLNGVKVLERY